jgi:hypothetical protein
MNLNRISEQNIDNWATIEQSVENIINSTISSSNYILEIENKLDEIKYLFQEIKKITEEIFQEYSDEKMDYLIKIQEKVLSEFEKFKIIITNSSQNKEWDLLKISSLTHKAKNVVNYIWILNEWLCKKFAYAKDSLVLWIDTFLVEFDFFDCNNFSFSDFLFDKNFSKLLFWENIKIFWNWTDIEIKKFSYFVYLLWEIRQNYEKYGKNWTLCITHNNDNNIILNFTNEIKEVDSSKIYSTWNWTIIIKKLVETLDWKINRFWINEKGLFEIDLYFHI